VRFFRKGKAGTRKGARVRAFITTKKKTFFREEWLCHDKGEVGIRSARNKKQHPPPHPTQKKKQLEKGKPKSKKTHLDTIHYSDGVILCVSLFEKSIGLVGIREGEKLRKRKGKSPQGNENPLFLRCTNLMTRGMVRCVKKFLWSLHRQNLFWQARSYRRWKAPLKKRQKKRRKLSGMGGSLTEGRGKRGKIKPLTDCGKLNRKKRTLAGEANGGGF